MHAQVGPPRQRFELERAIYQQKFELLPSLQNEAAREEDHIVHVMLIITKSKLMFREPIDM